MSQKHIRDVLAVSKAEMKQGKVSTTTLCGRQDPKMNTLAFADPYVVAKRQIDHICEQCRNRWIEFEEAVGDQARALFKFRQTIHKTNSFSKFGSKKSALYHR